MPPGFEWVSTLHPVLQFAVMVGIGIGGILLGRNGYKAGLKEEPVKPKDLVLTAAGIMDMGPVREAAAELKGVREEMGRIADELGTVRQILAEDAEGRENDRNYRRGLADGRRDLTQPPRPRR